MFAVQKKFQLSLRISEMGEHFPLWMIIAATEESLPHKSDIFILNFVC